MAHITETDYKKMAEAIADDLVQQKIPLNESIRKLASSMEMSQEQVRRLCESANNTTFNKMFQAKDKTASDRIVEFDVADADHVLADNIKQASADTAPDSLVYLSEYRSLADSTDDGPELTKVGFELRPESAPSKVVDRRTLRKTLDHLRHEKIASEMIYGDTLQTLKRRFARIYQDVPFSTFEKNAAALHGERAVSTLNELRRSMRMPAMTYDFEVLQKNAGYVDDSAYEYSLLSDAVSQHDKVAQISASISKLEALV
jgi:AraC-like DNA-binding protein